MKLGKQKKTTSPNTSDRNQNLSSSYVPYKGSTCGPLAIRHGPQGVYEWDIGGNALFKYSGPWEGGKKGTLVSPSSPPPSPEPLSPTTGSSPLPNAGTPGKFVIKGMSTYVGDFTKGEITGWGTRKWNDGREYTGPWVNGEMHGKGGTWRRGGDEEVYEGEMVWNKRNGQGCLRKRVKCSDKDGYTFDTYKGDFCDHKMHGSGIFVRESSFMVEGSFVNNVIQGDVNISWNQKASFKGTLTDGFMHGDGYFVAKDGSYEFEGKFDSGLPIKTCVAESLHIELDRTAVKIEETQVAAPVKGKAPPPKAGTKGAAESEGGEVTLTLGPNGAELGKIQAIMTRGLSQEEIEAAAAALEEAAKPPAKGAKAPPAPVVPAGPPVVPNSLPCERRRMVNVRLRPVTEKVANGSEINNATVESFPLWLQKRSFIDFVCAKERFPPSSIVFVDGENRSILPPKLVTGASSEGTDSNVVSPLRLEHDALKDDTNGCVMLLAEGATASVNVRTHLLSGASDSIGIIVDFRLEPSKIISHIQDLRTKENGKSKSDWSDICVASFSHSLSDIEIESSKLQLLLRIPTDPILEDWQRHLEEMEAQERENLQPSNDESPTPKPSVLPPKSIIWRNCIWELSLLVEEEIDVTIEEEVQPHESDTQPPPIYPESADSGEHGKPIQFRKEKVSRRTVCSQWHEGELATNEWHSVSLQIKACTTKHESNHESNDIESSHGVSELVVDGNGRMHATGTSQIFNDSIPVSSSADGILLAWLPEAIKTDKLKASDEPEQKHDAPDDNAINSEEKGQEQGANHKTDTILRVGGVGFYGAIKTIALHTEVDKCDTLKATYCFAAFAQQESTWHMQKEEEKNFLLKQARTSALEKWQKEQEEEARIAAEQAKEAENETSASAGENVEVAEIAKVPDFSTLIDESCITVAPEDFLIVQEASFPLICGSADFSRLWIPNNTPEGSYILEIYDSVNPSLLVPSSIPPDPRVGPVKPEDIEKSIQLVWPVKSNVNTILKIAKSST